MGELITVDGQTYDIQNWEQFQQEFLFLLGQELVNSIQDEAIRMKLFDSGRFVRGINASVDGDTVTISADTPYAAYLEFGTLEFGASYGDDSFPERPFPKKKNLSRDARKKYPRGMQPFAPFRRVLYNENKMKKAIKRAVP